MKNRLKMYIFHISLGIYLFLMLFSSVDVFAVQEHTYSYTGEYQEFISSVNAKYRIQLWGAQGGNYDSTLLGGLGGYTEGEIDLKKGDQLYIYVGGQPSSEQYNLYGGWNGGGSVPSGKDKDGRAGGGATDVRVVPTTSKTTWNALNSLASRIMVAAGGGGASYESSAKWRSDGGAAGGLLGNIPQHMGAESTNNYGTGASQIIGGFASNSASTAVSQGTFGLGGRGLSTDGGSGGGGGWYGGGGSNVVSGGGGGSSYISGHNGCIAVDHNGVSLEVAEEKTNQSYSFTGYSFKNTKMIDGLGYNWTDEKGEVVNQPTPNNVDKQQGNYGHGYAKITFIRELSNDATLKSITSNKGELTPSFSSSSFEYDLLIDTYEKEVEISAEVNDQYAEVSGTGVHRIKYGQELPVNLVVTADDGSTQIYTVHVKRKGLPEGEHSTKLAELDIIGATLEYTDLDPAFDSDLTNYSIDIGYKTLQVKLEAIAYDSSATVKIEGNDFILDSEGDITITVSAPNCSDTVYTIHYKKALKADDTYEYDYTGDYQTFVAPAKGNYMVELWGAQGGGSPKAGGLGAYTKGTIYLDKGKELYIYVGGTTTHGNSFNGGALGKEGGFSGGGATDVRLKSGDWNNFDSLKSRIMVAAGGGGGESWSGASYGGAAGGLYSYDVPYYYSGSWGSSLNTGATQTAGGKGMVGKAENGANGTFGAGGHGGNSYHGGGAGSGYYGGGGGGDGGPMTSAGSGGSSYISGHPYCDSILEESTESNIIHSGRNTHYSNIKFTDTEMVDGLGYSWIDKNGPTFSSSPGYGNHVVLNDGLYTGQPTIDGSAVQEGKEGAGYAKITPLFLKSQNNYLSDITASKGTLSPSFSATNYEYDLILDKEVRKVELEGILMDSTANVIGGGNYSVRFGEVVKVDFVVTAENGFVRTYTVNIKRDELAVGEHSSKLAELDLLEETAELFKLDKEFDSDTTNYSIDLNYNTLQVKLATLAYDPTATIKVEGSDLILDSEGDITITVSAPDCSDTVYTIHYKKDAKADDTYEYDYTGDYQTFIAPTSGKYRMELWGAQGGSGKKKGGLGAYTKGELILTKGEKLYIYVGNSNLHDYSFNGGAIGRSSGFGGGGATDLRLVPGTWDDFDSLKSRIMVAAGGGGSENWNGASYGGAAGGLYAYDVPYYNSGSWSYTLNTGAGQTAGGKGMVGYNQNGTNGSFGLAGAGGKSYGGGGGAGYYGGAGGGDGGPMTAAGSGGSSYISGHAGCNSITADSTANNIKHTDQNIHYSNVKFTNTEMIDGLGYKWISETGPTYTDYPGVGYGNHVVLDNGLYTGQPDISGLLTQEGKEGNGYAKITPLFLKSENNYLSDIKVSTGTLSPSFSATEYEYDLILDKEEREVDVEGILADNTAIIAGNGHYKVKYGTTVRVELVVTSESGLLRTYVVNIKREELDADEHSSLLADLDLIVEGEDTVPIMDPIFKSNVFEYHVELPPNMIFLDVDYAAFDPLAVVKVKGNGLIIEKTGEIELVVNEPHSTESRYVIKYTKEDKPDDYYAYNYTGDYQTFIAPIRGNYRFELWGSQGASSNVKLGGLGAYTKGDIFLEKGEKLYIYVGNSNLHDYSFNGGAIGRSAGFGGGGATDIRLIPGKWDDFASLKSRIMVAAGGGGAESWSGGSYGGAAGGLYSYDVPYYSSGSWNYTLNTGATQTAGGKGMVGYYQNGTNGSFGVAGAGGRTYGGGGGAGYYGGAGGGDGGPMTSAGSGGSSYISGHLGCDSISEDSTVNDLKHTGLSTHYSTKVFKNTEMIDGLGYKWISENGPTYTAKPGSGSHVVLDDGLYTGQPTIDGKDIQEGKDGLGYAKVTPLFQSKNNYLLNLETNYGTFDKEFSPYDVEYTLTLDKYEQHFTLSGQAADDDAVVTGLQKYELHLGEVRMVYVNVTAPNGDVRTYKIKVVRGNLAEGEHSTKLVSLKINQDKFALSPEFISIETKYKLEVAPSTIVLDVEAIPYDQTAKIEIEGNGYLKKDEDNIVRIKVTHPDVEPTTYEVLVTREEDVEGAKSEFSCTNGYQKFVAPGSTYYKTQLWGASGGFGRTDWVLKYRGGLGAYTEGEVYLRKGQTVYVYVGCTGEDGGTELSHVGGSGGFNGGASGGDDANRDSAPEPGGGGGGATDVRLIPTAKVSEWKSFDSLKSRIMVAAGGGGGAYYGIGGAGGVLTGLPGYGNKSVPLQDVGYAFGYGMKGLAGNSGSGGAGGGYFGGYSKADQAGGGGNSFVSGCDGCIAIDHKSTENNILSTGQNKHYSNYVFDKIKMLSGEEVQPNPEGGYQTGNAGDGYAIITASKARSENNFLKEITVSKGTLTPEFDILKQEYTVYVEPDDTSITIDALLDDDTAVMTGTGTFDVEAGENSYSIIVTAENGDIRVYTVKVIREKSSNPMPLNIEIAGLVPTLCSLKDEYCNLTPGFNPDTNSYQIIVPNKIKQIEFVVTKANPYQTVKGDGLKGLDQGSNEFVIEVQSEDGSRVVSYTYNIIRDQSGDANIDHLAVIDPATDIEFDPEITDYYFSVPDGTNSLDLEVILSDNNAEYEVVGNADFENGINIVQIVVTAQNGDKKTYTLNVYREQSGNTFISEIEVSHDGTIYPLSPTYNKIITTYIVNVGNEVADVSITATSEHPLTTITGGGNVALDTGTNKVLLTATASDGSVQVYELYIIRAKSSDATLKSLDVLEATLDPAFERFQEEYNLEVNSGVTSLTLNPVVNHPKAKYKISGNSGFALGLNKVVILVTAEDGTQKTYTLNVNKKASSNNYLSTLVIDKYDLTGIFDKEKEVYDLVFETKIPLIKVSATPEDANAKVSKTGTYYIKTGSNQINIIVTSEDGSKRTYTLNIFQRGNTNNNLISLVTSSKAVLTPSFTKENTKYQLEVENNEDEITVIGVSEDSRASVTGNGTYHLNTGINTISITVTSEEGDEKVYQISVDRKQSTNNHAAMIIAKESVLDPVFNRETTSYVLKVLEEVTSLTLTVDLEDDAASYEIIDNENFQIGHNTVIVRVTAEDLSTKDYVLDVIRQEAGTTSNRLTSLDVDRGTLDPVFTPDGIYYEVEVPYDVDRITLSGELEDKNADVEGLGEYTLSFGKNVLGVIVTSTEGVVRTYQVVVTRKRNDEARLATLQVTDSNLDPTFDKDVYEYNLKTNDTSLTIKAIPLNSNATFEILDNHDFEVGNNNVVIRVTAEDGVTTKDYILHVEREKSLNNNLKSLEIDSVSIDPVFNKTTTVYYATVGREVNNILITAEAEDSKAKVAGDGMVGLELGVNYIDIIVTSEAGTEKVYTLIVTREADSNNYLSSLMTSEGTLTPEFTKTVNDYTVEVSYEVEDIVISGTLENTNAVVSGLQKYALRVGDNPIAVTVTAEDGSINVYNIVVTRKNIVSSKLKHLSVDSYVLDEKFASDLYDYHVTIDYEVESLNLNIETLDQNATYEVVGNQDLKVGMNTIEIIVTDSLGSEQSTYIIHVNKQNYSNNFLSYIYPSVGELTPTFDKEKLSYTVEVENSVSEITIFAEVEVSTSTLVGAGHYKLVPGDNEIQLVVTSPNGIKRIYYVNVIRKKNASNHLTNLVVKADGDVLTLDPKFDPDTSEYHVKVNAGVDRVEILATSVENASISGVGTRQIAAGLNRLDVTVTSQDGVVRVYTVNVERVASNNANLLNIIPSVGSLSPAFSSDQLEYSLVLDPSSSMLSFSVVTDDKYAQVSGVEAMLIPDGESTRLIKVVAEDKSEKVYTIHVYKDRTDEARLSSLSIDGYTFNEEFDPDRFNYTVTVPNTYSSLLASSVNAVPLDNRASVKKMNSLSLSTKGDNLYTIIVTAHDGFTKQTYTISVTREKGSDSTLASLNFKNGTLSPAFTSSNLEYILVLPDDVTLINKSDVLAIANDLDATVTIVDSFIFDSSHDTYEIVVESADKKNTTTYTIHLKSASSSDNLLTSLSINPGTLDPSFDPNINEYSVSFSEEVEKIEITARAEVPATVLGDGKHPVKGGENRYEVVVTAGDGSVNTYVIVATKEKSANTNIVNIIPSVGSLAPEYSNDVDHYLVEVGEEVTEISFDVILESDVAVVSGNQNRLLDYGKNTVSIVVTAEDGSEKEVFIDVVREKKVTEIEVDKEQILLDKGNNEKITAVVLPSDATYKELAWSSSDSTIATVSEGIVTALEYGKVDITVYSVKDPSIKKVISVEVLNLNITSKVYEVRRSDGDFPYIIGAEQNTSLKDFVINLDNKPELIHFYTIDGIEITDLENEKVKTGDIVKLEYNGKVYDELYIAVRGEINGDGEINVKDYNEAVNHTLKKKLLENYWFSVANVDDESSGIINVKDSNKIQNKILKKIPSLNP